MPPGVYTRARHRLDCALVPATAGGWDRSKRRDFHTDVLIVLKEGIMAGYLIANIEVKDPVAYEEYRKLAAPTVEKYGGRYVVRGGALERLEGEWQPRRLVILEFPSVEQARRWYASDEYRPAKAVRQKAAVSDLIIAEGVGS